MSHEQTRMLEQMVINRLEPYRDELVANLRRLIKYKYSPQVGRVQNYL